jgi:hypothetical protein
MTRHMMKPRSTNSDVMMSTVVNEKQLSEIHGTARCSDAITSGLWIVDSPKWTIWCSDTYFLEKACTNSPPAGRVLSG